MKYSIEKDTQGNPMLFEEGYEVALGEPNALELEFWARIQELEKLCAEKEERINKLVFEIATWGELLKKNK